MSGKGVYKLLISHPKEETEKGVKFGNKFSNETILKYGSLIILTVQNCAVNLLMRMSRTQKDLYITSTAVLISEIMKLVACILMVYYTEGSVVKAWKCIENFVIKRPLDTLKVAVPSLVYYAQNNLLFVGATHLDAATCQISYQLKILTTAIFSVLLLKKRLFSHQWIALVLLFAGVALVQAQQHSTKVASADAEPFIGFVAILTACFLSGFAGVYFEKILKGAAEVSLWVRNVQMSALSIVFGSITIIVADYETVNEKGFFFGYTLLTWTVVALQALGGLICAVVVKYADNILKGFATSLAIVLSCIISTFYLDFHPTGQFLLGGILVICSVFLYSKQTPQLPKP